MAEAAARTRTARGSRAIKVDLGIAVAPDWRGRGVGTRPDARRGGLGARARRRADGRSTSTREQRRRAAPVRAARLRGRGARDGQADRARPGGRRPRRTSSGTPTARSCRRSRGEQVTLRPLRPDDREALLDVLARPDRSSPSGTRAAPSTAPTSCSPATRLDGLGDRGRRRVRRQHPGLRGTTTSDYKPAPASTSSCRRGSRAAAWARTPCGRSRATSSRSAATTG